MFVKFFQLSEKFGALQKGQGDVSAPPPTSYHIKLNEIYQIDSRAVDCQILLKKCDESIVTKWYKLYLIHVTKKNVIRPSNESIQLQKSVKVLEKRSRRKKTGYDENDTKRKRDRWDDGTREKKNAFSMFKYLGNKKSDTWGLTMKSLHTSRVYYTRWSTERERQISYIDVNIYGI